MNKIRHVYQKVKKLLTYDIWIMNFSKFKPWKARLLKILKIVLIVITDVPRDRCPLRAKALTYSSLLAIVPLFAVVFSVLKGFGFQNKFGEILIAKITNSPEIVGQIIGFINNTNVQSLGAIGGVALLFTSVSLFGGIEKSFSDIWHIKTSRSFIRQMTDYLFIIMVVPIFLAVALTVSAGDALGAGFVKTILSIPVLNALVFGIYPYISVWIVLFLLYTVLISTKVKWSAAVIGAIVAGSILHWAQGLYVVFASGLNKYNIIFGSFAQPILAIIWINVTWNIILIGSEVVYAVQNVNAYQVEGKRVGLSQTVKERASLVLLLFVVRQFRQALPLLSLEDLVLKTQMPVKVASDLLQEMTEQGVLVASVNEESHQMVYSPAVDSGRLTVGFLMKRLRASGINEIQIEAGREEKVVAGVMLRFDRMIDKEFGKLGIAGL